MKSFFKEGFLMRIMPHIVAVALFVFLAYAYLPGLLGGKVVNQSDDLSWRAVYQESKTFHENTGEDALWTNSIFGGMPTTTIALSQKDNMLAPIFSTLFKGVHPASDLVVAMLGFYLLLLVFGVNRWLSIVGAIAFVFCSYNMQIIAAGHNTKLAAIAFMPWVVAGFVYAFRRKPLFGAVLFGIAMSFELLANHPQITFYLALSLLFYGIYEFLLAFKAKTLPRFFKIVVLLLLGGVLAIGSNANRLWQTWDYAQHTMRGGSKIADDKDGASTGLDLNYATAWSYGVDESWNMLIPNFVGGSSAGELSQKSETYKVLKSNGVPQANQVVKRMPLYWGSQQFTAGPMYMGAITIFLFLFAILLFNGPARWVLVALSLLVLMLSWGSHFMPLTEFFHKFVPLYNKFRVPSMILVLLQMVMPLMGILALQKAFLNNDISKKIVLKKLAIAAGITGGFCIIFALMPTLAGNFVASSDSQMPDVLKSSLRVDRASLLTQDAWRSLFFIAASALVLFAYLKGKLKLNYAILAIGVLVLSDLWSVDRRYLNDDNLVAKGSVSSFNMRAADKEILKDKELSYRVMDLSTSQFPQVSNEMLSEMIYTAFNNSVPAYYHKLTGGYSAAKMQSYQDIIDNYLTQEIINIATVLNYGGPTKSLLNQAVSGGKVMNMLNTKYFIFNQNTVAENPNAMGNAWFVSSVKNVSSLKEEISSVEDIIPQEQAVMMDEFAKLLSTSSFGTDSIDHINLTAYTPNSLTYEYYASGKRLAVFSEVYYPGWKISIDGIPMGEALRANYILRAAELPAGSHVVKMTFEPNSYKQGNIISLISSTLLLFLFAGLLVYGCKKRTC